MSKKSKKSPGLSLIELPTEAAIRRLFPKKVVEHVKGTVHKPHSKKESHKDSLP